MKTLLAFCCFLSSLISLAQTNPNHVYVSPYTKGDGTYVPGYYRTAPNSTNRDNFSTTGNTNPYTGQPGWIAPDNKNLNTYNSDANNSSNGATYSTSNRPYGKKPIYVSHSSYYGADHVWRINYLDKCFAFHQKNYTALERKLIKTALYNYGYEIEYKDEIFSEITIEAIEDLQERNGLKVDGKMGRSTLPLVGLYW